jgi:hypothetical protein
MQWLPNMLSTSCSAYICTENDFSPGFVPLPHLYYIHFSFDFIMYQGCAAAYIFMANIFTVGGMREDAESIETMRVKYAMASKHASHIL